MRPNERPLWQRVNHPPRPRSNTRGCPCLLEQRLDFDTEPTRLTFAFFDDLAGNALGQIAGDGAAEAEADFLMPMTCP